MHASLQLFVRLRFHSELGITNFGYVRNPAMSISRSISTTKQEWNNNLVNYSKENNKMLGQLSVYIVPHNTEVVGARASLIFRQRKYP